jgi:hypothetical protein
MSLHRSRPGATHGSGSSSSRRLLTKRILMHFHAETQPLDLQGVNTCDSVTRRRRHGHDSGQRH